MRTLIVIPARMAATRLPGKPLADIHGRPMIAWVAQAALRARLGPVLVAAGEAEIAEAAQTAGAHAVLTDPALPSGTDRVYAAAAAFDRDGAYEAIVNLQGDMPAIDPGMIASAVDLLAASGADIATLASPSAAPEDRDNPNVVKAVIAFSAPERGRALYFTRAAAPSGEGPVWRHLGLYVYRRAALARFVGAPPSLLEQREKLEQLRALEMGMSIEVGVVADFPKGVDSPADLEAARAALLARA
ncbi:MAG TPA: 3-deoxy-manno-octulosonate cytidylyltransferase [Caulobacterales bacterium]|jgi:3-deoxy-manno-octulosonate cytidylyltransferase (CMP-KDO synthetase)|nr:3-deoxy-manno-octulosonate cytidylyltransferase [Caulobacterales bacterium]